MVHDQITFEACWQIPLHSSMTTSWIFLLEAKHFLIAIYLHVAYITLKWKFDIK
jgi:hypothetical protein